MSISFVTYPYEATIYLDDQLLRNAASEPYTTPCTIDGLVPGTHRVAFQWGGQPRQDAGQYDFARTEQIVVNRPE